MFHNHTNHIPLYVVNRPIPNDPPPRYSRHSQRNERPSPNFICLSAILLFCFLLLLLLIILGQTFILIQVEQLANSCTPRGDSE